VLYTGSEDGVLAGWSLPDLSEIRTGDRDHDNDGGDGREDIDSADEDENDGMDVDEDEEESSDDDEVVFGGKRGASEVLGSGSGGKRRKW
jgi:hypothetical protein